VQQTVPDSLGRFVFCPVLPGTYDVVAVALTNNGTVAYSATVVTGVQPGNAVGNLPLVAPSGTTTPASLTGSVTTVTAGSAATSADVQVSALQQVTVNSTPLTFTVPLAEQAAFSTTVTTQTGGSCGTVGCASYTLVVPAIQPNVGVFNVNGTTFAQGSGAVSYTVDAQAFQPNSTTNTDCTPSRITSPPVTVTAGASSAVPTLAFTGCT
jgi:hypothetical protein